MKPFALILISLTFSAFSVNASQCVVKSADPKEQLRNLAVVFLGTVEKTSNGKKLVVKKQYKSKVPGVLAIEVSDIPDLSVDPSVFDVGSTYLVGTNAKAILNKGKLPMGMCDTYKLTSEIPDLINWLNAGGLKAPKLQSQSQPRKK